jgi:hypothetical protein
MSRETEVKSYKGILFINKAIRTTSALQGGMQFEVTKSLVKFSFSSEHV